ncbi:MAG: hypothetical protein ABSH39_12560 [Candidatus Acidiferrum sp.]
MDIRRKISEPFEKSKWQAFGASWACPLSIAFLALTLGAPARSQQQTPPADSVVDAARRAREHQANSANHPKIVTNDELSVPNAANAATPDSPTSSPVSPSPNVAQNAAPDVAEAPKPPADGCDNPNAERLKAELEAAQGEQEQLRRELSYNPAAISPSDVDPRNFKPGSSGLSVGVTPQIETQPPSAAQVAKVDVDEKIASLTRALRLACDSPKEAKTDSRLDEAEQKLRILQRQYDLDQNAYYSQTNYAADTAGKANLDAEQQQIQDLQSEIDRLKEELASSKPNLSTS